MKMFGCTRASSGKAAILPQELSDTSCNAMPPEYHVGQRVSFKGNRCTVRYFGEVEGTDEDKVWLGVEWDDPTRGKHNGEYLGRRYFRCMVFKG
jgi:hypothetical protein